MNADRTDRMMDAKLAKAGRVAQIKAGGGKFAVSLRMVAGFEPGRSTETANAGASP